MRQADSLLGLRLALVHGCYREGVQMSAYYSIPTKAAILLIGILLTFLFVILCQGDDALHGTIQASYTYPKPSEDKRIKALLDAGFELSWQEPNPQGKKWVWMRPEGLPWIRVLRVGENEENETLWAIINNKLVNSD